MSKSRLIRILLVLILAGAVGYRFLAKRQSLADRLISLDDATRNIAVGEIPKVGDKEKNETVSALGTVATTPDARQRRFALFGLRKLAGSRAETIPVFIHALSDADKTVREEASVALVGAGEVALPALFEQMKKAPGADAESAARIVEKSGDKAVPGLSEVLKGTPSAQMLAAGVLKKIGKSAKAAAPALMAAFASNDPAVRLETAEALEASDSLDKSMAAVLGKDLLAAKESYKDPLAPRPRLARLLEKADPRKRELIDLGFDLLQKNAVVRYRAAFVLSESNPPKVGALEMLLDALDDKDVYVSARAMVALCGIGLERTERVKKIARPRITRAVRRAQQANIEGFDEVVQPALDALKKT